MRYYIAYGSNLSVTQMGFRCPTAQQAQTAVLPDCRLEFRGLRDSAFLTIAPEKGSNVPVLLWKIKENDEKSLDRYEGYPSHYRKEMMEVEIGGRTQEAMVYVMNEGRPFGMPSDRYLNTVLEGYDRFGFDPKAVEDALKLSRQEMRQVQTADYQMRLE